MFNAIVAGAFTWFVFSALGAEQIRIGVRGRGGHMITRCDQPNDYWFSVGWFLFFTAMARFVLGLSACRMVRNRNHPRSTDDVNIEE